MIVVVDLVEDGGWGLRQIVRVHVSNACFLMRIIEERLYLYPSFSLLEDEICLFLETKRCPIDHFGCVFIFKCLSIFTHRVWKNLP